jgi:hypothetical protein
MFTDTGHIQQVLKAAQSFPLPGPVQIGQVKPEMEAIYFELLPVYIWSIYFNILYDMALSPLRHQDL